MTKNLLREYFIRDIFDIYRETFESSGNIYLESGTSLLETLDSISAEQASKPISVTCATIAAQVAHVRFYLEVMEGYLIDKPIDNPDWGEIWRTIGTVTPDEWEASKMLLKETYQRILTVMKNIDSWEGEYEIGRVIAILTHTAYHLGEIRQATCVVKEFRS